MFFCEPFLTFDCCSVYREVVEALAKRQQEKVYRLFTVGCWVFVVGEVVSCWLLLPLSRINKSHNYRQTKSA